MRSLLLLGSLAAAAQAASQYQFSSSYLNGFKNPRVSSSSGGHAVCIEGSIPVTASANNTKLHYASPANQTVVSETVVEMVQINSTLAMQTLGGPHPINGTWDIHGKLCYPVEARPNPEVLQFLIHGVGFDRSYWDVAANYSYVDAAALAGYTTFSYDRLGIGMSDTPDPINVVQSQLEVAIAHELIQLLRAGKIANCAFQKVVSVGHSFGSIQTVGLTSQHPKDLDAAVLTGFSTSSAGQPVFFASLNLAIANENSPLRFSGLPNGYLVAANAIGNQQAFLRAQNFPPSNLRIAELTKATFTIGEFFTAGMPVAPSPEFTGPVDVVDGTNDLPFCQGNCLYPVNQAEAVLTGPLYPNASNGSEYYIAEGAGHGLNLHYSAPAAYEHITQFLKKNGF